MRARLLVAVSAAALVLTGVAAPAHAADPCASLNAIACENSKPGDDPSVWDISRGYGAGDDSIQGFGTEISVNPGSTIKFKIKAATNAPYTIDIFRLGYYAGKGARRQATTITVSNPVAQPTCIADSSTNNYDCGNWAVSSQWLVPTGAVSGIYVATLNQGGNRSQITFIVRDDSSLSDVIFKTSDMTWQAYNTYGGASFYVAPGALTESQARAFKISYNRPFATRGWEGGRDFLFSNEYPTLRLLERNGIDVSYTTDIDVSAGSTLLTNHKAFMSVGHDEYWSLPERAKVEAARDAGVNLMFLSGNEVYWHTRLEPSIDGTSTDNRTLVCYKDTWEPAQIDPVAGGTSTWRDPRYQPYPNGSNPENSLTGTAYMSNFTDLPITVSASEGKARLWRGTSLASLPVGGSARLAPHTVGYESDEDLDNGVRPAGLMHLSTTTGPTEQYVQNAAGNIVRPGTTTHNLTLYRAPGGALVFGAGTVQWGWGLDQTHDGDVSNPADTRMQQATINMLADMSALPTTLMSGLTMPVKTTDATAPTVTITTPAAGASLASGTQLTISGTAAPNVGVVTVVEVSTDGGHRYERATGTTAWSYTGVIHGTGPGMIKVRAADDSANLSAPVSVSATVNCPCSLFGQQLPGTPDSGDGAPVTVGMRFQSDASGFVMGVRFYKSAANTGTHIGTLWSSDGAVIATGTFTGETASGWQTLSFNAPVSIQANTSYVVGYYAPVGHYAVDADKSPDSFWLHGAASPPLRAPAAIPTSGQGVYAAGTGFPTSTYHAANYYVDVLFYDQDVFPPVVTTVLPIAGSSSVPTTILPQGVFNKDVVTSSIVMSLTSTSGKAAGSVAYNSSTRTATFTPDANLAYDNNYSVSLSAKDSAGNTMPAPMTWNFRTQEPPVTAGLCPCGVWDDTPVPQVLNADDPDQVELGMKFRADYDGIITGVRFYKGIGNIGTHTGSLWSPSGQLLNTVTFSNESTTGWQKANFATPTAVTAGAEYTISYHTSGHYSYDTGGLAAGRDAPPLHVPPSGAVYKYGASGFPTGGSSANYWVDAIFTLPPGVAPEIQSSEPGTGATNVPPTSTITVRFAGPLAPGTGTISATGPGGTAVSGVLSRPSSTTLVLTPATPMTPSATYTVTVSGAKNIGGTPMAQPVTWSFTTSGPSTCPCTLFSSTATPTVVDSGDASAITLGVRFVPATDGFISAVRFYKSAANTGQHTVSIWSTSGVRLASATASGESASGWQSATLSQPLAVTAGTEYVAGYYAPNGHYSYDGGYFNSVWTNAPLTAPGGTNGVYRYGSDDSPSSTGAGANYWVTPVFQTGAAPDLTPPWVTTTSPAPGATHLINAVQPTATFSEDVKNVTLMLSGPSGSVAGTQSYDAVTRRATLVPSGTLGDGVTYTASAIATDLAGNAMATAYTWSFTTGATQVCPCSVFTSSDTPATPPVGDPGTGIALGMAFSPSVDGFANGVRFYKGPGNSGLHTGRLSTESGVQLATVDFTGETASGWQTASFADPVALTAGTTYVVSYVSPTNTWSATASQFDGRAYSSPPLTVPDNGGRYSYAGGFPNSQSASNYWVDVVFTTTATPPPVDTTAPVISAVVASGSGTSASVTWTTDESGTSVVQYGASTALGSTASGASGTAHAVTLSGLTPGVMYYYRVSSVDAAGNSAVSPATSGAPASFTMPAAPDTTPPVISAVAASGSGTSASVTWTTDESGTSVVQYGASTALGSTASGASGTAHAVTLSGLTPGVMYYYRVSSVDAAGNSAVSPATSGAPASFTMPAAPDTTPPVISAVAASGSGTSASVTWTTDESGTSVVQYGASTALGSTASGASGTAHAVTLSGLTPNTRYYYRVSSADSAANTATSPATPGAPAAYVPTVAPITHSTVANFGTGSGAYVSDTSGGEVISAPTLGTEFAGTVLPSGWGTTPVVSGGTVVVAGGMATLSGSNLWSTSTYGSGRSVSASAQLSPGQSLGWGSTATGSTATRASFVVTAAGDMSAVFNDGRQTNTTKAIPGSWTGAAHEYRIDRSATTATMYIDGIQVATNTFQPSVSLRILAVDPTNDSTKLPVDWIRIGPYTASSTFTSAVIDAGAVVGWDTLTADVATVTGSTVTLRVRSGSSATPGSGWTSWANVPVNGSIIRSARYLQYQIVTNTTGTRFVTSATKSVNIGFHVL